MKLSTLPILLLAYVTAVQAGGGSTIDCTTNPEECRAKRSVGMTSLPRRWIESVFFERDAAPAVNMVEVV